jgi:hypothetical protein
VTAVTRDRNSSAMNGLASWQCGDGDTDAIKKRKGMTVTGIAIDDFRPEIDVKGAAVVCCQIGD